MMKNKIFKAVVLIGIIGNIGVGLSFLLTGSISMGIVHLASGIIFMPMYLDSELYNGNDDTTGI
jgi:hypothetical protein